MNKSITFLLLAAGLFITGCNTSGAFIASNNTTVELSEGNYTIVANNITGEASSAFILGGSYSWGLTTKSFGLIPLGGTKTLYKDARENLWNTFEAEHGQVDGRKLALTNIQYDSKTTNFVLYSSATVYISADVVEFDD